MGQPYEHTWMGHVTRVDIAVKYAHYVVVCADMCDMPQVCCSVLQCVAVCCSVLQCGYYLRGCAL